MATQPVRIPASGGEVILAGEAEQKAYERMHFAAARRSGDTIYISGVIVSRASGEGNDVAAFKDQVRRAFQRIGQTLAAACVGFADVAMINSFHVFDTPHFAGSRGDHFAALAAVKEEFMLAPHPAWTAVGTTALLSDTGIVEIQMIAHAPRN